MQALQIADDRFVCDSIGIGFEPQVFLAQLRLYHVDHALYQLRQVDFLLCQQHLAAFDLGGIQHLVDQADQEVVGKHDFVGTVQDPFRVVDMRLDNPGHPLNGVERRSQIVAHPGQEVRLGPVRVFRRFQRVLQGRLLFGQLFLHYPQLGDVGDIDEYGQIDRVVGNGINAGAVDAEPPLPGVPIP